jgi:hypothetical protein
MRKLGPGVIRKNEALANGKQRRSRPPVAGFVNVEQRRSLKNFAGGRREQTVQFIRWKDALQQKQINGHCQGVTLCQAFVAVNRKVPPMEAGDIGEPEAFPHRSLAISEARNAGNRLTQGGHVGFVH